MVLHTDSIRSSSIIHMPRTAFLPDLPLLATPQSCATWRTPPLDGSLSMPEIIEWNGQHNRDHPVFVYPFGDAIRSILWPEFSSAMKFVAHKITSSCKITSDASEVAPVVAILASTDVISYQTLFFGIMRADCIPFPISPRNSATAVAHLLHAANVGRVFLGHDDAMRQLMQAALLMLKNEFPNDSTPVVSDILLFDDVYGQDGSTASNSLPTLNSAQLRDASEPAFIMHSSGSTSFPKLIPTSHRHIFEAALVPFFGSRNMSGKILSTHGLPSFHGLPMGMLLFSATSGSILGAFQPQWPPIAPTPEHCFEGMKATNSDYAVCVPSFVEAWALNASHVDWFRSRQGIIYAGGPLAKATGDHLISQGVSVFSMYGSTESGILSVYLPATVDMDWEYFQFSESAGYRMIPNGNNTFEYMILPSPWWTLSVVNAKIDGSPAYASSDLFRPHPTKPGFWKVFGRNDDQIMHSTGEKTNPGPLDNLNKDPRLAHSVMFGRGRFHAGVIVEPVLQHQVDPVDAVAVATFRNKIWPTVEEMNAFAPQHSRIFKEMILIASPTKPFSLTSKNTARRSIILEDYADEINALYDTVEETSQALDTIPNTWDIVSTTEYVRSIVNKVLVRQISNEEDLFQQGACDSLQATWIRNTLLRALRENAELDARGNADNFVYHHPTIALLSKHVHDLAHGEASTALATPEEKAKHMTDMVIKYLAGLPQPSGEATPPRDASQVLLVGPTGSLGSHILERLIADDRVSKVFALGRSSNTKTLRDRLLSDFQVRGLDEDLLTKVEKVVYLEGDLTRENLGLSTDAYEQLRASVTSIISNSWRVDFNLGLRGVVDLALRSTFKEPPRLMFISSIGILEEPVQSDFALGNGYSESKWVAEEILTSVASQTTLRPLIVRVGQVCGGRNGFWNSKEWFPSMVQSALKLGAFPCDDRAVSWLPVHVAAEAIVDFLETPKNITVIHLAQPKPVFGRLVAETVAARISVALISSTAWLDKLEKAADAALRSKGGIDVQAFRFLHIFRTIAESTGGNKEAYGMASMSMDNALSVSQSLSSSALLSLSSADVNGWMTYWESTGLLE
ncbi:acetyl-CoA synthetase-like protein [Hymenopellis radicata]|nr:acetyl-CoA synthetase-like protein [Hymenopellis radicata]